MADQSQGPGWWQASDGKWYPPRWEYDLAYGYMNAKPHLEDIYDVINKMGRQGWEAVSMVGESKANVGTHVAVLMKRQLLS
jgi:hypothetical protein